MGIRDHARSSEFPLHAEREPSAPIHDGNDIPANTIFSRILANYEDYTSGKIIIVTRSPAESLLIKESESTEIDEFMSRKSGLIDKEDFTPEQQVYYDYTCQTGDFIKMCTVPSLRMDESDLVKEKKMLTL